MSINENYDNYYHNIIQLIYIIATYSQQNTYVLDETMAET